MKQIQFQEINRADRIRQDYKEIPSLAQDIATYGLIQPISITPEGKLIAGGRRSTALQHILDHKESFLLEGTHPSIQSFIESNGTLLFGIHFTLRTVSDLGELSELELLENTAREDFTWQERTLAIQRIHTERTKSAGKARQVWFQSQTAKLFKLSDAKVSLALKLATELNKENSELWKIPTIMEAMQLLTHRHEQAMSKELAARIKQQQIPKPDPTKITSLPEQDTISTHTPSASDTPIFIDEFASEPISISQHENQNEDDVDHMEVAQAIVTKMDMVEYARKHRGVFDHIFTDPPYGIDVEGSLLNSERVDDTHDEKENERNFKPWLVGCYKALKEKGFCIWFCAPEQWAPLKEIATEVGFKCQPWPFIWKKTSPCVNRQAQYNTTKDYEFALVMRKGDAQIRVPQKSSFWSGCMSEMDQLNSKGHPFAKPNALWKHLFQIYAGHGQIVWDPFSGCGSMTIAALESELIVKATELEDTHYVHQLENVVKHMEKISNPLPF